MEFHKVKGENLDWHSVSGNVVITGVGVDSIISILESIPDSRLPFCRLILGPQNRPERLRSYILARGILFEESNEWIVREGSRYRHLFLIKSVQEIDTGPKPPDVVHWQRALCPSQKQ